MRRRIEYEKGQVLGDYGIEFVEEVPVESRRRRAKFKCHCGNEFIGTIEHVKKNYTVQCSRKCKNNLEQYKSGQILGNTNIEFIEEIPTKVNEVRKAKFKCYCGNEFITSINSIKSSQTESCGCNQNRKKDYIEGQEIGAYGFIFLKDVGNEVGPERKALVRCHCGKEYIATISRIANNRTKSCGCSLKKVDRCNFKKICIECGKEFLGGVRALYCINCKTRTCPICGNKFIAKQKNPDTKEWPIYCSRKCRGKAQVGKPRLNIKPIKYIIVQCKNCNKDMLIKDWKRKREFCSRACQGEYYSKLGSFTRAEKPQPWRKYIVHTRKYKEWRKAVLIRDGGICRECWDKEGIKNRKDLAVHHIIPIYADKTKMFKVWNGITLCTKCHRKTINHEAEFSDYYFKLLKMEPIKVNKQWYKEINPNQIIKKLELGYTQKQIAKQFQVCVPTIVKRIEGCILPNRWIKPKKYTFYSIMNLRIKRNSIKDIAKITHIDSKAITKILALWGNNLNSSGLKGKGLTNNVLRKTQSMPTKKLAAIFGVSSTVMSHYKKSRGFGSWSRITNPTYENMFSPAQRGYTFYSVLKMYLSGLKVGEIAKIIHTEQVKVARVLKLWGNNLNKRATSLKAKGLTNNVFRRCKHLTNEQLSKLFNIDYASISRHRTIALKGGI